MGEQVNLAQILQQLTQALNAINGGNAEKQHSELFATINTQIAEFSYDSETDRTFATWFERYGPYIERDGQNLPDEMKVRLLIGKLGSQEYVRYTEGILPQKPTQISFKDTVTNLGKLFCGTKSLFVRRFEAFQLTKADHQSPIEFADQVNASCETAKMELSKEEVKALIFVSGIGDADRDLRERCLRLMEEAHLKGAQIRFAALVEECRTVLSLRSSAAALSRPIGPNTNSISVKPQRTTERSRRPLSRGQSRSPTRSNSTQSRTHQGSRPTPPSPCRWCNQMHWMSECSKRPPGAKWSRRGPVEKHCRVGNNYARGDNIQKRGSMSVLSVDGDTDSWLTLDCLINARPVSLTIDTGSRITIIQTQLWEKIGKPPLSTGKSQGKSYSGHKFELTGSFNCDVTYAGVTIKLQCYVSPDGVLNLFGLPWIRAFESKLRRPIATTLEFAIAPPVLATCSAPTSADELTALLKREFPIAFSPGLGHCNKMKAHLYLQSGAQPVFCRARPVPHGAREAVDAELDRLLEIGAIKQIDYSQWAAPIVAVKKKSGEIRVCIDFSTGLNDRLELNRHPLPRPEDIFSAIRGASIFSQIDFKDAYLQVELDEPSKHLVGLNTHRGLFQYQRLPFGVKSAPSIFQKLMDELIAGLPGVFVYLDDFVVASANHQDHCSTLRKFFGRLQEWGLRVRLSKCKFMCEQLKFLGHIVSADGIRPDPARSAAIESMPAPTNAQTLRSLLGAINYYSRFVKQMREIRTPLDELLKKDVSWHWGTRPTTRLRYGKADSPIGAAFDTLRPGQANHSRSGREQRRNWRNHFPHLQQRK
uniref:Reverse transcriptase domain-containing protein n=1 Tax=Globodera rostochiensis TaxID=31243 RepID=A0A914H444_GLORO